MLDELDQLYSEPEWWMASSDGTLHTQAGVDLMRGRHLNGQAEGSHSSVRHQAN
ncbi:hypothetical protein [Humibacillus xanthopallidus]|uniref:hypothetical protein n=1 Tax=Humibacillus xanthopallidus TaxID=412689 RepID=UPI00163A0058|nr:hypothetical protein [Humibacillus xanthopallidus]